MSTFTDQMYGNAATSARGLVTGSLDAPVRRSWGEVHQQARKMAGALANAGVGPGSVVAVLAGDPADVAPLAQAVWMRGASLSMLQQPTPVPESLGVDHQDRGQQSLTKHPGPRRARPRRRVRIVRVADRGCGGHRDVVPTPHRPGARVDRAADLFGFAGAVRIAQHPGKPGGLARHLRGAAGQPSEPHRIHHRGLPGRVIDLQQRRVHLGGAAAGHVMLRPQHPGCRRCSRLGRTGRDLGQRCTGVLIEHDVRGGQHQPRRDQGARPDRRAHPVGQIRPHQHYPLARHPGHPTPPLCRSARLDVAARDRRRTRILRRRLLFSFLIAHAEGFAGGVQRCQLHRDLLRRLLPNLPADRASTTQNLMPALPSPSWRVSNVNSTVTGPTSIGKSASRARSSTAPARPPRNPRTESAPTPQPLTKPDSPTQSSQSSQTSRHRSGGSVRCSCTPPPHRATASARPVR
jgi:hypothetical protein